MVKAFLGFLAVIVFIYSYVQIYNSDPENVLEVIRTLALYIIPSVIFIIVIIFLF